MYNSKHICQDRYIVLHYKIFMFTIIRVDGVYSRSTLQSCGIGAMMGAGACWFRTMEFPLRRIAAAPTWCSAAGSTRRDRSAGCSTIRNAIFFRCSGLSMVDGGSMSRLADAMSLLVLLCTLSRSLEAGSTYDDWTFRRGAHIPMEDLQPSLVEQLFHPP